MEQQEVRKEKPQKCLTGREHQLSLKPPDHGSTNWVGLAIDSERIYSTPELKQIIRGFVKLQRLRNHGLRSIGRGYLGLHVLQALERIGTGSGNTTSKFTIGGLRHEQQPSITGGNNSDRRLVNPTEEPERQMEGLRSKRQLHSPSNRDEQMAIRLREKFKELTGSKAS